MLWIKVLRLLNDKTAHDIARQADISAGQYSMIERGHVSPCLITQKRLEEVFDRGWAELSSEAKPGPIAPALPPTNPVEPSVQVSEPA